MSKLSYKTLFIIFFFLLIGVVVLSRFVLPKNKVSAAWWNDSWHYRQAISITNSSGSTLTNQRVKVILDTATLVIAGKMQSDCDDIRITDINGNLLDYWTTNRNTSSTSIYIKIPSLATTATTIYVYYGNSSISTGEKTLGTNENPGTSCQMMKDQGSVTTNGTYYIVPGGNDTDKQFVYCDQTTDGGGWTLVMNQKTDTGGFFTNSTQAQSYNESNPTADRYSILGKLSKFKDNGVFTFKLNWPALGSTRNIWSQTSNPISENIVGYSGITIDSSGCGWGGIAPSQDSSATFIDGSPNSGTSSWWFAIASYSYYAPGLPGSCGNATTRQQLWVKGNDTMNNTSTSNHSEEAGGGPVAYWKFDEGVGTTAYDFTNTNNGILSGSTLPTWQTEENCISGKCLLNTGGYISVNNLWTKFQNSSFSISSWVYFNDNSASDRSIVSIGSAATDTQLHLVRRNNKIYFAFWGDDYSGDKTIEPNIWYHISVTWDSNTKQQNIYVNGTLDKSRTSSGSLNVPNSSPLLIGLYATNSTNGYIDEFKIYPYARTAAQIKLDYNSRGSSRGSSVNLGVKSNTAPSLKSKLVAYYKFDENNGTIAYNSNGNNNHGTLTNSPIWFPGKIGNALEFLNSGSEPVQPVGIPGTGILENITDTSYSFSAWIKPFNNSSTQYAISRPGYHSGLTYSTSQKMQCGVWNSTNNPFTVSSNGTYPPNSWYFVTCTIDDANKIINVYVNGKFDGSVSYSGTLRDYGTIQYNIGSGYHSGLCSDSSRFCFNGLVDEFKLYNTVLTAEEVKQDYNQGSATTFGSTNQTIGGTTTSLEYCIPGDTSYCANPVAEWKMDEGVGTSTIDISGNNNNGTLINSPTWVQGKIGSALNFGTNKYINTVASSTLLNGDTSFTVQSWFKTNQLYTTADPNVGSRLITIYRGAGSTKIGLGFYGNNTDTLMAFTNTSPAGVFKTNSNFNDNKWHHLSATYNNSTDILKLFYDGIEVGSTNVGTISSADSSIAQIGTLSGSYPFNGSIDHIKIYNYARTPAQIAYDYNKGGPVGWWKFDECQGNIAYDWSKNNNNGTINIGTSGTQTSVGTCTDNLSTSAWNNGKTSKINSSLNFDGMDDYISGAGTSSLSNISNGSISFWIYPKGRGTFPGNNQEAKFLLSNSRPLIYGTGGIAIYWNGASNEYPGGVSLPDNIWTHVTVTWQNAGSGTANGNILIYYNGLLKKTMSGLTLPINTGNSFNIGGYTISPFNGQIDDVRIYNYALTSEQVKQVYNGGAINFQ